jgi:hypothetical protein
MSTQIRAALRAAIYQAIAVLGEKATKEIIAACLQTQDDDHWGRRR